MNRRPSGSDAPRLARRLLFLALPADHATHVAAELEELFSERTVRDGAPAARRWYWRQTLGFVLRARGLHQVARDGRGSVLQRWANDLKIAIRSLAKRPGFAGLAVLTLALGIGANTAIFSVIHGSLLRPLPYADADRVVRLSDGHERFGGAGADQSVPNLLDLRAESRLLDGFAIYKLRSGNLTTAESPERVRVLYASAGILGVLGMTPARGRDLLPSDDRAGVEAPVILTDELWRTRFGGDPGVVGKTTVVDARPVRIVGVTPPDFFFPGNPQLVMALQHVGAEFTRGNRSHFGIGRLVPGATIGELRRELQGTFTRLEEEYPEANEGWYTWADPFQEWAVGRHRDSLFLIGGAVALVLLIACVNVANLMLVRAETRQAEYALRYSLGARRSEILSHFVSEGFVLAAVGGGLGVIAAYAGVDVLVALYGDSLPRAAQIGVNRTVLVFGVGLSAIVGIAVGLIPWLRATPGGVQQRLRGAGRGAVGRLTMGRTLVVAEVALAVLLVIGAGLLTHSMWRLQNVDLGLVDEEQALTFRVSLPVARYDDVASMEAFYDRLVAEVDAMPGVQATGLVNRLPLLGGDNMTIHAHGEPERVAHFVSYRTVTPGYFTAAGARLARGRWLDGDEFERGAAVVMVNESLAAQLFPGEDPVGRHIGNPFGDLRDGWGSEGLRIVGVIVDIVGGDPDRPAPPAYYMPFKNLLSILDAAPSLAREGMTMSVVVRTAGDPTLLIPTIRQSVQRLDPEIPIFDVRTLADLAADRLGSRRFAMSLLGAFAGLALLLGAIGIYGIISFGVSQRARELGVRIALGASQDSVRRMVLRDGMRLTLAGLLVGLVLAFATGRVLDGLLYGVSSVDPVTYGGVAIILLAVCLAAAYVPARRATRLDPMASIRAE